MPVFPATRRPGGFERLDWALDPKPDAVILELGANDALRGIDPKEPRANLDKMLADLKSRISMSSLPA